MNKSKKFLVKIKDARLFLKGANTFNVQYRNCKKESFEMIDDNGIITITQTEKVGTFYWLKWVIKGTPEIIVSLPKEYDFIEIEGDSNQITVQDMQVNTLYAKIKNGKVEAVNVKADTLSLLCINGKALAKNVEVKDSCIVRTLNGSSILEGTVREDTGLEVACENGIVKVNGEKYTQSYKTSGRSKYFVYCLNGKAECRIID